MFLVTRITRKNTAVSLPMPIYRRNLIDNTTLHRLSVSLFIITFSCRFWNEKQRKSCERTFRCCCFIVDRKIRDWSIIMKHFRRQSLTWHLCSAAKGYTVFICCKQLHFWRRQSPLSIEVRLLLKDSNNCWNSRLWYHLLLCLVFIITLFSHFNWATKVSLRNRLSSAGSSGNNNEQ